MTRRRSSATTARSRLSCTSGSTIPPSWRALNKRWPRRSTAERSSATGNGSPRPSRDSCARTSVALTSGRHAPTIRCCTSRRPLRLRPLDRFRGRRGGIRPRLKNPYRRSAPARTSAAGHRRRGRWRRMQRCGAWHPAARAPALLPTRCLSSPTPAIVRSNGAGNSGTLAPSPASRTNSGGSPVQRTRRRVEAGVGLAYREGRLHRLLELDAAPRSPRSSRLSSVVTAGLHTLTVPPPLSRTGRRRTTRSCGSTWHLRSATSAITTMPPRRGGRACIS